MSGNLGPMLFFAACGGIFVLALFGLGGFLIAFSVRNRRKAEASQNWLSVPGRIVSAEVKQGTSRETKRDITGEEREVTSYYYYPAVEYTYEVGGQTYTGKRLAFGGIVGHSDPAKAAAALAPYQPGSTVTVYYDPQNPAEAVLERKAGGYTWGLVVGAICLLLGACIACVLLVGIVRNLPAA